MKTQKTFRFITESTPQTEITLNGRPHPNLVDEEPAGVVHTVVGCGNPPVAKAIVAGLPVTEGRNFYARAGQDRQKQKERYGKNE